MKNLKYQRYQNQKYQRLKLINYFIILYYIIGKNKKAKRSWLNSSSEKQNLRHQKIKNIKNNIIIISLFNDMTLHVILAKLK